MPSLLHKICISLLPESFEQLRELMPEAQEADIIEVRIDHLGRIDFKTLRSLSRKPLIVTLRSINEGGFWKGKPAKTAKILQAAVSSGIDYIDIEFNQSQKILAKLDRQSTKIILSYHTPGYQVQLKNILEEMVQTEADVYKLVFEAENWKDNLNSLNLMELAKSYGVNFVIHAMGEKGKLSRLLGALNGNIWTYTAKEYHQTTAPGQLAFHEAKNFYYLHQKSTKTKLLGLVGSPILQSKGWRLHNQLIAKKLHGSTANNYLYVNFHGDDFEQFWEDWNNRISGLSVTIPFKEKVVPYLAEQSAEVRLSGVCNTLVKTSNGFKGYNTDVCAIESLLRPHHQLIKDGGLIVGTGATARSAIAAFKRLDVSPIFVVGRNIKRGKLLMDKFGIDFLQENEIHYAGGSIVVQTTPVGMTPYTDKYPPGTALFRKNRVVLDVVYNPSQTRFLQIAKDRGCITISGLEMFLLQAAHQFELFTGETVTIEEMKKIWNGIS